MTHRGKKERKTYAQTVKTTTARKQASKQTKNQKNLNKVHDNYAITIITRDKCNTIQRKLIFSTYLLSVDANQWILSLEVRTVMVYRQE